MEIDAVLEVEPGDPQIAIDFLLANVNLSKSRLKDLMHKGGVWRVALNGERERIRRAMTDIFVGEQIEIFYDQALLESRPLRPELLHDEGQYSVWMKPAGTPLTGSDFGDFHCFERAVELAFEPARPIFWLSAFDYQASGIVLIAHTRKAAADLTALFDPNRLQDGTDVRYRIEVQGDFPEKDGLSTELDGHTAELKTKKIRYDARPDRSVVDVWLVSGVEQQVRRQFAQLGHPLLGDEQYGEQESDTFEGLRMKLTELRFICPVTGTKQHFSLVN